MAAVVHYQRHDDTGMSVGVIRIDNPPVNALSQAVRTGLLAALEEGLADREVEVLVLLAEGRTFIAGADIREFGKPPRPPILPEVIARLEASVKPVIAALHGTALGGGLEVALGCQLRVALPGTRVGLPEVRLGLLPGAGGTQRLPRLTGIAAALELIISGRFVSADEALRLGIVDRIDDTATTPLEAGLRAARQLLAGELNARVTGALPRPETDPRAVARCREALEAESPELFSPFRCVEAIETSATADSLDEGLALERKLFLDCMASPQRAGLIHAFFAARSPHRVPGAADGEPVTRLALFGDHPLFERLRTAAGKSAISLVDDAGDAQACLVAPGATPPPQAALRIALIDSDASSVRESGAELALVVPARGDCVELIALDATPERQQAVASALKALRLTPVVSRSDSILARLRRAHDAALAGERQAALEAASLEIAADGLAYRDGDIDLLAIEVFDYPRHLGGPHYRASAQTASSATRESVR